MATDNFAQGNYVAVIMVEEMPNQWRALELKEFSTHIKNDPDGSNGGSGSGTGGTGNASNGGSGSGTGGGSNGNTGGNSGNGSIEDKIKPIPYKLLGEVFGSNE